MSFEPTPHPVLGLPTPAQAVAMGEQRWREAMAKREEIIQLERLDPFKHQWEPPIWRVCDALLGFPWVDEAEAEALRQRLGFKRPVRVLLVLGGNRAGKSQWASSRLMRVLFLKQAARAWALHSTLPMSRQYQQPLLYHYLPAGLKSQDIKSKTTYIAYKQKTGFSEEQFVLPPARPGLPGNDCLFKTYDQDVKTIEGGNLDVIWPDELVPPDWVETMELRIAERNGWMPITFTPVEGYSDTVRLFLDGAVTVLESVAFLCPKDGGPPDVPRALGFEPLPDGTTPEEQLDELRRAELEGRAALYAQSVPERFDGSRGPPAIPAGREFERVPRVLKCADEEGKRAVVFFHSSDNPFGNPKNVYATIAARSREFLKERFYGVANKTLSARFPKFNRNLHVVRPDQMPAEGTNYHFVDPCNGRNFFMHWYRVTDRTVYLYREWPSEYNIPGIGVPGPWAVPNGRHPDGRRGPAQKPFGWGLRMYKQEIARLEGWKKPKEPEGTEATKEEEAQRIDTWSEHDGAREVIDERYLDSRFASTPKLEKDRPVTLLTEFEEMLFFFTPTPGNDIDEGVELITDALDYDDSRDVDFLNQPRLLISAACVNTIYALTTWTGLTREGRRCLDGATKDPIDLLRYFFLSECPYLGGKTEEEEEEEDVRRYY
jgi:phage terminase large subunit-like protein